MKSGCLRVTLVTHYFSTHRGGVEQVAGQLARRLASTGQFEVTWVASDVDALPAVADRLRFAPVRANNLLERIGFPWPLWPLQSLRTLRAAIAGADVVHLHDFIYFGNLAAFIIARRCGKPVLLTQHIGDIPYQNPLLRLTIRAINRTIGRLVLGRADRVAFISDAVRQHFSGYVRFRRPAIHLPNGVDTEIFHPVPAAAREHIRRKLGVGPDERVVLYVGRFVDKKGLPLLRQLATTMTDIEWWFAGWGTPNADAHPANWNLPNATVFGDRSGATLADLYRAADLLVLPSMSEGFPLVVQEAMACGTQALVTTAIADGAPQAGELLKTCRIDPPEHALELWRAAVASALTVRDEALRDRLAMFAQEHWAWERTVDQYTALLREVAKTPAADRIG